MTFYHSLITEKSWEVLRDFRQRFNFILIGGWAVFLYTHSLKSKDIDVICSYEELQQWREKYELSKNGRLKKYEIKIGGIDIDIYLPYYSQFPLPIKVIEKHTKKREGFIVPRIEILLILKQGAYQARRGSSKGEKDKIDILSLLLSQEMDLDFYLELIKEYHLSEYSRQLILLLKNTKEISSLHQNVHQFSRFKKQVLKKLKDEIAQFHHYENI